MLGGVPFQKGFDPRRNKGGARRPRTTFASLVRERVKDGKLLVDYFLAVLDGTQTSKVFDSTSGNLVDVPPTIKEQMDAARWLADRGWGRPFVAKEEEMQEETGLQNLSDADLLAQLKTGST